MKIIPKYWSYNRPLSLNGSGIWTSAVEKRRYIGRMMACWGRRLPAVNSIRTKRLRRQLYLEMAYATIDPTMRTMITAGIVTTRVLKYACGKVGVVWPQAVM